ncbi:MAG: hypothetical protein Q9179_007419, partial [Wetmoreana sp. 5 TL-2023]
NAPTDVDYTPHPEKSIKIPPEREAIVKAITNLYSGSASKKDMEVYAEKSVYDDPWSFCDTRYKIAGQWYGMFMSSPLFFHSFFLSTFFFFLCDIAPLQLGRRRRHRSCIPSGIPKLFASTRTLATEVVSSTPTTLAWKQAQEYTPKLVHWSKTVNSLVTCTLDEDGKVVYHKDQWNHKDYSHEGLGKVLKTLNGDYLTGVTRPPKEL